MLTSGNFLAVGTLVHHRFMAPQHRFVYQMRQFVFDLDEIDVFLGQSRFWSTKRFALGWFRREDFLDEPRTPLKMRVLQHIDAALGFVPSGKVLMLVSPRCWGFCFNPLTLYFCFEANQSEPCAVVAEVRNTPWFQRHIYVLDRRDAEVQSTHPKVFHVSPFLPMDMNYEWTINLNSDQVRIGICNRREQSVVFKASLVLSLQTLDPKSADRELWLHWPQSLKTLLSIYWQAVKLLVKRSPFFSHPRTIKENRL
jgi:hypothetical protein